MKLSIFRLALPVMVTLGLSACTTIEERDLPKCSGSERRPLNADLWNSSAPPAEEVGAVVKSYYPDEKNVSGGAEAIEDATRWNVAASEKPCGKGA